MQSLILTLHIIVCVLLVILILLQSGKEGMGVIFGGGNSSVFGSTGAGGILAKLTTLMAIIFIITSLSYTYVTSSRPTTESVILNVQIEEPPRPEQAPPAVAPEAKPGPEQPAVKSDQPATKTDQPAVKADQPEAKPESPAVSPAENKPATPEKAQPAEPAKEQPAKK